MLKALIYIILTLASVALVTALYTFVTRPVQQPVSEPDQQEPPGIVVEDFEGEADPNRMSLDMKTWLWQRTNYNDERVITPAKPGVFTLTFSSAGTVAIGTDCNTAGGTYTVQEGRITLDGVYRSKMLCQGSQEDEFIRMLELASEYHFTSRGELILGMQYDGGTVVFR